MFHGEHFTRLCEGQELVFYVLNYFLSFHIRVSFVLSLSLSLTELPAIMCYKCALSCAYDAHSLLNLHLCLCLDRVQNLIVYR